MNPTPIPANPPTPPTSEPPKLVDAHGLLAALFDDASRPSLRWVRTMQKRRVIPYIKVGHLVRFDLEKVRAAIDTRFTVQRRSA